MLLIILNFIRQHWLGVAESILLATIFLQHVEISHLASKLAQGKAENATLYSINQQLSASVKSQNAAIASMQAEAKRKSAAAAKSLAIARSDAKKYAASAAGLKAWKPTGDACADMKKLLDDYVKHGE
jgi:hypothetical protein